MLIRFLRQVNLALLLVAGTLLLLTLEARYLERANAYFVQIAAEIGINIVLAVSLNLINGLTGQFSLGHAGFMAVGAYASAAITFKQGGHLLTALGEVGLSEPAALLVAFIPPLLAAALASGAAGLVVGLPTLRLRGDYLAIATLGFGEIIRLIFNNFQALGGSRGFSPEQQIPTFVNLFWVYFFVALTLLLSLNLARSAAGRELIAVREDELAAAAVGVDVTRAKVTAFVLGAALAGIAGCLFAHRNLAVQPNDFNVITSIMLVIMVVLGGMGSITGCTLSAVALTLVPYGLRYVWGIFGAIYLLVGAVFYFLLSRRLPRGWLLAAGVGAAAASPLLFHCQAWLLSKQAELRMLLFSILLIVLMLSRPQGLLGNRELALGALRRLLPGGAAGKESP